MTSPDGRLRLSVDVDSHGVPYYNLNMGSRSVITDSRLGMVGKQAEMTGGFKIENVERATEDSSWKPVWGEYAEVRDNHNEMTVHFRSEGEKGYEMTVRFRLFNDGLGFRYEFPTQQHLSYWTLTGEQTEFNFPADNTLYCIPGDYDTDELLFHTVPMSGLQEAFSKKQNHTESQAIEGLCVQTPLMIKTPDANPLYINIHEANLRNYGAMMLDVDAENHRLTTHIAPDRLGVTAYIKLPFHTPWRTIIVSDKATDILASQLIYNLNEPCALEDTSWIKPRKFMGVWWEMFLGNGRTWAYSDDFNAEPGVTDYSKLTPNGRHAANNENVKKYIDFASAHGIEGLLVEGWNEGWEDWSSYNKNRQFDFTKPYPDFDVDGLMAYAKERGVQIICHNETAANAADYERQLEGALGFMKDHGYDAVKTGYVGAIIPRTEHHTSQWMVDHVLYVAQRAADYHIMVDSHEAVRPTGICRTYPNWVAQESARGGEFEGMRGNPPEHTTILPFTRFKGGPMDYTPGLFEMDMSTYGGQFTHKCGTTLTRQLALYLTIPSPMQMVCDLPENYEKHLDAFKFIEEVPVDWQDSHYLEAEPGDYITVARKDKNSENWYVGAITDENPRTATIDFSFLPKGVSYTATIYADGKDADWATNPKSYTITTKKVTSKTVLKLRLAAGGGAAISLKRN
jgi:hypothetical protein